MEVVYVGSSKVAVLPVVRGLVSEERKVESNFNKWTPGSVALSISKEELEALKQFKDEGAELETFEEEVYVSRLSEFGEVRKPPPCFHKAVKLCTENEIECVGVDMTEVEYTDAYCHFVSTFEVMRASWFKKRLQSDSLKSETPEEFVLKFDQTVNKSKGFQELEKEREKVIAHKIWKMAKTQNKIMAVIELERSDGVLSELKKKRR
ncbi:MAG: hypothetical protein JSV43_06880 [Methanobacteriota archaeon]|nr:MAG: hypothetical protein JSV43_06880 [Euryarchaeota archaeon]